MRPLSTPFSMVLGFMLLFVSNAVPAASSTTSPAGASPSSTQGTQTVDADEIRKQLHQIQTQVDARKGPYKRLGDAERDSLRRNAEIVHRFLPPSVSRVDELNEHDQIAVFNALQAIQALANQAEEKRLICERYKPTGTKRPLTVCKSVAERKLDRDNVDNEIARRFQFCIKKPDGTCET